MKSLIAAAVAAALVIPFAATAADKAPGGASGAESMFKSLDKNNDGFISRDEVKGSAHEKDFAALDKNKDGKLSREEHAAASEHSGDKRPEAAASGTPAPSGGTSKGKSY